jgi:hypothetical protein
MMKKQGKVEPKNAPSSSKSESIKLVKKDKDEKKAKLLISAEAPSLQSAFTKRREVEDAPIPKNAKANKSRMKKEEKIEMEEEEGEEEEEEEKEEEEAEVEDIDMGDDGVLVSRKRKREETADDAEQTPAKKVNDFTPFCKVI